eukprot:scaffold112375_cov69-Phaeocystis_antarctica.AAC.7
MGLPHSTHEWCTPSPAPQVARGEPIKRVKLGLSRRAIGPPRLFGAARSLLCPTATAVAAATAAAAAAAAAALVGRALWLLSAGATRGASWPR